MALLLGTTTFLSACGGGGSGGFALPGPLPVPGTPAPPTGLSYAMTAAVYEVGQPVVPNRPSASGGAVEHYGIAPALPEGLVIDSTTGVISGTPTAVSPSAVYEVTATNPGGSTTTRVEIEVRQTPAAPAALTYRELTPVYTAGQAIAPNAPTSSGGPITGYSVTPALPAGLLLDAVTGVISGTPGAPSPSKDYVVSGFNATASTSATLRIAVQAAVVAPAALSYASSPVLYVSGEPIVPNTPQVTGGPADAFSVTPPLPAGLSLNTATGLITGTPAGIQSLATYTVTASNSAGSAQAPVQIAVTGRGSWAATASLSTGRHYMAMARLADGRVLAIGGQTAGGPTVLADLYEPSNGTWTPAAPMLHPRSDPSATLLPNGRVLVAGGDSSLGGTQATAELYDPVANTWTATGSMIEARTRHTATLLPNGKVLVIGGYGYPGGALTFSQTAELYDPATGTWTMMSTQLSEARTQHAAELLPGGNAVLVAGGLNRLGFVTSAELFPVADAGSTVVTPNAVPKGNIFVSVRLANGSVLVTSDGSPEASRYDPATATWTTSPFVSTTRRPLPTMTVLADGRVLLAGGNDATAEIYNPDFNVWTAAAPMATARNRASASLLPDGRVLVFGGFFGVSELAAAEIYTP